jgi:hypothetical protein
MSSKKEQYDGFRPYYPDTPSPTEKKPLREVTMMPSTVETIDFALFDWLNEKLDIFCTTNEGWRKVPLIWSMPERAFQVKDNKDLRNNKNVFTLPAISIERASLIKDPSMKGVAWAHIPRQNDAKGGAITVARRIQQEKTSNFANATSKRRFKQQTQPFNNNKVVYETITMPIPTYVVANYKLTINTEYQQQMNEIFTPFMTYTGQINNFFMTRDGHKFEGFIENDFSLENNTSNLAEEERSFKTVVNLKVLGYLIGSAGNDNQPKITVRENAAEFRFTRERVVLGDKKDYK